MESRSASQLPLVVIIGPTASGKTDLAIALAKKYGGEIICADSRTIYKGMDIGTAKPTKEEQSQVPHWGLDLVEPRERFTAADFKMYANTKIEEIRQRGNIPFLVGGTGLYVDSVLFDYSFGTPRNNELCKQLEKMSEEELRFYCIKNNIEPPENAKNKRHIVAAIERNGAVDRKQDKPLNTSIIVGITTDKTILNQRIAVRTEQLFKNGVVEEAIILGKKYGWNSEAFTGNAYRAIRLYLSGEITEAEVKDKITTLDRQLAKRQRTWFRRNKYIHWLSLDEARLFIEDRLANL